MSNFRNPADKIFGPLNGEPDIVDGNAPPTPGWISSDPAPVDFRGIPGPQGPPGDMDSLVYDPRGIGADCFDIGNMTGVLDGGTFN